MRLRVLLPDRIELDRDVEKVCAEGHHGEFCLLPRHVDFAVALTPGVLSYVADGQEHFLATDRGVLVKCGELVSVATSAAAAGELGDLQRAVEQRFVQLDENESRARSALEKIGADFVRRFIELERPS